MWFSILSGLALATRMEGIVYATHGGALHGFGVNHGGGASASLQFFESVVVLLISVDDGV